MTGAGDDIVRRRRTAVGLSESQRLLRPSLRVIEMVATRSASFQRDFLKETVKAQPFGHVRKAALLVGLGIFGFVLVLEQHRETH